MRKVVSCGTVIVNERNELLLGLVTGGEGRMDLPKGLLDDGSELPLDCAHRECLEETGFDLDKSRMLDLGVFSYMPGKDLHLFKYACLSSEFSLNDFHCTSFFEVKSSKSESVRLCPEILSVSWVAIKDLESVVSKKMYSVLANVIV